MYMHAFRMLIIGAALLLGILPTRVAAHGGHGGHSKTVLHMVGAYQLTITVTQPSTIHTPLLIEVTPHDQPDELTIVVQARSVNAESRQTLPMVAQAPSDMIELYYAELYLEQHGEWLLEVRADGSRGSGTTTIPITISPPISTLMLMVNIVVGVGALLMLMMIAVVAMRVRYSVDAESGVEQLVRSA